MLKIDGIHDLGGGAAVCFSLEGSTAVFSKGEAIIELDKGQLEQLLIAWSLYPQKSLIDRVIHADPTQR